MKFKAKQYGYMAGAFALSVVFPAIAHAATATGGGGMPYSPGLNTYKGSATTEIAAIICMIGVIGGVAVYLQRHDIEPLLMKIVQVIVAICVIGGAATFITAVGVAGAIVT
jgi:hypothetical protein